MKEYIIPKKDLSCDCYCKELTQLKLHTKLEALDCSFNKITKLTLNKYLLFLYCRDNNIKELKLNNNLIWLQCDMFVEVKNINNPGLTIAFE